jgi:hypothetical protein
MKRKANYEPKVSKRSCLSEFPVELLCDDVWEVIFSYLFPKQIILSMTNEVGRIKSLFNHPCFYYSHVCKSFRQQYLKRLTIFTNVKYNYFPPDMSSYTNVSLLILGENGFDATILDKLPGLRQIVMFGPQSVNSVRKISKNQVKGRSILVTIREFGVFKGIQLQEWIKSMHYNPTKKVLTIKLNL